MEGFLVPFFTILAAELFDKSQLAILLLASQTKKQKELFLVAILAFLILTLLAVITGGFIDNVLPKNWLKIASGMLFIFFGIKTFIAKEEEVNNVSKKGGLFLSSFFLIFISELGDKTQISTIVFASYFSPILVFLGSLSALSLLTFAAVKLGGLISNSSKKKLVPKVAGLLFVILGLVFLFI